MADWIKFWSKLENWNGKIKVLIWIFNLTFKLSMMWQNSMHSFQKETKK